MAQLLTMKIRDKNLLRVECAVKLLYGDDKWYRLNADVQTEQYIQAVILPDLQKIVEFLEKAASADGGDS